MGARPRRCRILPVIQRHRDYINTKELKKVSVLSEADCDSFLKGFNKCCGIVAAHDPSRGRNADPPPPGEILQDIEELRTCFVNVSRCEP